MYGTLLYACTYHIFNLFEGNRRWPNAAVAVKIIIKLEALAINECEKKENGLKEQETRTHTWIVVQNSLNHPHFYSLAHTRSFVLALRLNNERKVVAILHRICRIAFKAVKATAAAPTTALNKIHGLMSTWEKCNARSISLSLFPSPFLFTLLPNYRRASSVQSSHSFCWPFACSYNRNDDDGDDNDENGDDDDTTNAFVVGMALVAMHFVYLPVCIRQV